VKMYRGLVETKAISELHSRLSNGRCPDRQVTSCQTATERIQIEKF
jgi:hypothetical protein